MNDSVGQTSAQGATIQPASLRLLTEDGDEVSYSSEHDLTEKIWESSIFTEGQPRGAVLVLLNIEDFKDQNSIQVDSPAAQSDLVTLDRTIAMLAELRRALELSRLTRAG